MKEGRRGPDRTLLVIVGAVAVLVVVALAVVFSRGGPELLDERTPQGVVQRYAAAAIDGDEAAASAYLTDRARENCQGFESLAASSTRVTLVSTTERPESADVVVAIVVSQGGGSPFGASEYETEGAFDLVKSGGKWFIDSVPWELMACGGKGAAR